MVDHESNIADYHLRKTNRNSEHWILKYYFFKKKLNLGLLVVFNKNLNPVLIMVIGSYFHYIVTAY